VSEAQVIQQTAPVIIESSSKSRLAALLLSFFVGFLGVHRFYVGKIGTGILWLCTFGLLGIGNLVDFIMIIAGSFKDKEGKKLIKWTE
jgi:TM2 domain-containing membrane protein YozV